MYLIGFISKTWDQTTRKITWKYAFPILGTPFKFVEYFICLTQLKYFCYPILPVKDGRLELLMDASFPISSRIPLKSVFWVSEAEWGSESISPWNSKLSLSLINYYYILLQVPVIDHLVVTGKNESLFESHWYKFNIVSFMIQNIYFQVWIKVLLELKHESFTLELCNITSIT